MCKSSCVNNLDITVVKEGFGALQSMSQQELWQWVHYNYGEELGLTSNDEADYVSMSAVDRIQFQMRIQREEKLSQQNTDSVTQPVDAAASKVISQLTID